MIQESSKSCASKIYLNLSQSYGNSFQIIYPILEENGLSFWSSRTGAFCLTDFEFNISLKNNITIFCIDNFVETHKLAQRLRLVVTQWRGSDLDTFFSF